jgi:two-component sensor histidine kinase
MFLAWGPELIFLYNDSFIPVLGRGHPGAVGHRLREVWPEIWAEIGPAIHQALCDQASVCRDLRLPVWRNGCLEQAYFAWSFSPIHDGTGAVVGICGTGSETTIEVQARHAQREKEYLAELFQQAPGFMAVLHGPNHVFKLANRVFREFFGNRDLIGRPAREAVPEVRGQGFFELLDEVYATGEPFVGHQMPMRRLRGTGSPPEEAFVDFVYQPITGVDGRVTGIFVEGSDVTDRVWAAEHQQLLINELNHRVKNTLATVQSIVSQTLCTAPGHAEARVAIERRLVALSRVHDVLTRESWEGAGLREIITQAVEPFRGPGETRIHLHGPEIRLSPRMALDLAMALHELATNALKYGALSNATGEVDVTWSVDRRPDPPCLALRWQERGGPPVATPTRRGFGARLIERSLARAVGGEARLAFLPAGVVCLIDAPIA